MSVNLKSDPREEIRKAISESNTRWLLERAGELHGHYCPGLAYGVRAAHRASVDLKVHSTGMEEVIVIVETNACFSDGVQFVTGCTFGNNALIYRDFGKTAMTLARRSGEGVRVAVNMEQADLARREPEAMELFQKVIVKREGTEEDSARMRELWRQASRNTLDIPDKELLKVQQVTVDIPAYAGIFSNAKCCVCGENIMEPRARIKDGQPICLACSGDEYYELTGNGMGLINKKA